MKLLAVFIFAVAVTANVQAVVQPYVVPIYRVTMDPITTTVDATSSTDATTTAEATSSTDATTTAEATSSTDAVTTASTETTTVTEAPTKAYAKYPKLVEVVQSRHPRSLVVGKPRGPEGFTFEHVCSGTLVDNSAIITTVTCIESAWRDTSIKPCVGTALDDTSADYTEKVLYEVAETIKHPDYNSATGANNIAILKLTVDVDYSLDKVQHITWSEDKPAAAVKCVTSYWGAADPFKQVNQDVTVQDCTPVADGSICSTITPSQTCPAGANGGSLVCDKKLAGIFAPQRNADCSATMWTYEEISKDSKWLWENVNAAPILNVSFAAILALIAAMMKSL